MDPFRFALVMTVVVGGAVAIKMIADAAIRYKELERDQVDPLRARQIEERLDRIEAAVDAIAVEVERIGEMHRFVAQLQEPSARPRLDVLPPPTGRVNTPK